MYFSPKKHVLSNVILGVALRRLLGFGCSGLARILTRRGGYLPDMADSKVHGMQILISLTVILLSALLFTAALRKVNRSVKAVPESERREIAKLQEETFGEGNAALNADLVRKLLEIWFVILVGVQLLYEAFSEVYRHFTLGFLDMISRRSGIGGEDYTSLYNLTHSFKYQGILIALLLGAFVTAIFLNDRTLKLAVALAGAVFLLSSTGMEMATVSVMGHSVGIVWSSLVYHLIDTLGLAALAIYLRFTYHGV